MSGSANEPTNRAHQPPPAASDSTETEDEDLAYPPNYSERDAAGERRR